PSCTRQSWSSQPTFRRASMKPSKNSRSSAAPPRRSRSETGSRSRQRDRIRRRCPRSSRWRRRSATATSSRMPGHPRVARGWAGGGGGGGRRAHGGAPYADSCSRVVEPPPPWLPVVLALSATPPYLEGRERGMLSIRGGVLAFLPRQGAPPPVRSYAEWERFI